MAMKRHKVEQGRAHQALLFVQEARDRSGEVAEKYRSYVKDLPTLIQTNGLGAALAFIKAKGTKSGDDATAYGLLYDHVSQWLHEEKNEYVLAGSESDSDDLVELVVAMDSASYRMATREVMTLLNWLRRLAEGVISNE